MTGPSEAPRGPGSGLTLEQALEALEMANGTVARVRDHNCILERQVMRLVEEDTGYRNALRGVGARLMEVGGNLAALGADLNDLGKYAIEQANQRVGVPQAAREEAAAADQPQQE